MTCDWNFKLNGIPISSLIIRRNQLKKGWPTQKESLVVVDPILGEITVDDILVEGYPSFTLEYRPKSLSLEDKSWLIKAGWRQISVKDAIAMLIGFDTQLAKVKSRSKNQNTPGGFPCQEK
jgi:hypothetical protein